MQSKSRARRGFQRAEKSLKKRFKNNNRKAGGVGKEKVKRKRQKKTSKENVKRKRQKEASESIT